MILEEVATSHKFLPDLDFQNSLQHLPPKMNEEIQLAIELQKSFDEIFENFEQKNLVKRSDDMQQPVQRVYQVSASVLPDFLIDYIFCPESLRDKIFQSLC